MQEKESFEWDKVIFRDLFIHGLGEFVCVDMKIELNANSIAGTASSFRFDSVSSR